MSGSIRARRMFGLLVLAALLVLSAALGAEAEAKKKKATKVDKIAFSSKRTTGQGVNNPTGDLEIFVMNPDGTQLKQLTFNTVDDFLPTLSPGGQKIAYRSIGVQSSNPEGDTEVYVMNSDGSGLRNLTNTAGGVDDSDPDFLPGSNEIAYQSDGVQTSNPEGDFEVYLMNLDGSTQQNVTDTAGDIDEFTPDFSPSGKKIAFEGFGAQASNPEGDDEVYVMNSDGSNQQNLSNTGSGIGDFEPAFGKVRR